MNSELISFYGTIFNIQITLIFIIFPILFVFIQLTGKEHTTYLTQKILRDYKVNFCGFVSLLIIIIAGFSNYLLSIQKHDFIKKYYFNLEKYITSNQFSFLVLMVFIINLVIVLYFVIQRVKETNSKFFIESYIKNIKPEILRLYLFKNYGLPIINRPYRSTGIIDLPFDDRGNQKENEKEYKKLEKKYNKESKILKKIQLDIDKKYEPVIEVIINALNYNLINIHINDFNDTFRSFIDSYSDLEKKLRNDTELIKKLIEDYSKTLFFLFSSSLNINYKPFVINILSGNRSLLESFSKNKDHQYGLPILNSLEDYIDCISMDNEYEADFILKIFYDFGTELIPIEQDEQQSLTEGMLRNFSRCSEKIIDKFNLKKQPIMMGMENKHVYDYIIESLYQFFEAQKRYKAKSYPLLLLDANYCVFKALITKLESSDSDIFKNYFYENHYLFFREPQKLFVEAVKNDNDRGACLCLLRLCELYDLLYGKNPNEIFNKNIDELVYIGFFIHSQNREIQSDLLLLNSTENFVYEKIAKYKTRIKSIDSIVFDLFLKSHSNEINIEKSEVFLMELAYMFESNFGLEIDWKNKKWNNKKKSE